MTHCRSATEMCSARWADGRATMTTEASSTIMSWATAMTARAQYRRGSGRTGSGSSTGVISWTVIGGLRMRVLVGPLRGPGASPKDLATERPEWV